MVETIPEICENCRHWTPTISRVIGECGPDMETKMAHQHCPWFDKREAEGVIYVPGEPDLPRQPEPGEEDPLPPEEG